MEPITERERHTMISALDELMGTDVASTLVRHLPPGGWADMATKHDLVQLEERLTHRFDAMLSREIGSLRAELHGEINTLRTELHDEISGLRTELHGEIGSLRTELHDELSGLRTELHDGIGDLRSEMHAEFNALRRELHTEFSGIRSDMQAMTRTYILGNVGLVFTVAAMAFGAARLV